MLSKPRVSSVVNDRSYVRRVAKQRQRFTPWLVEQIDSGDIDGLEWIRKEEGIFKVPWVRVDKPEFELETHAELFKRWAQHTGKYRPGDQPDPSTWKTRFRCALRKMQEIVEIKELGCLEGSKPFRAFKFEPKLKEGTSSKCRIGKIENRRRTSSSSESTSSTETCESREPVIQTYGNHARMDEWENLVKNTKELYPYYIQSPWEMDFRDMIEQAMPDCPADWDMSMYFPGVIQNQFGFSTGSSYGPPRDQEASYFDLQTCQWPSYLAQEGFNASMYNEVSSYPHPQMIHE